MWGGGRIPTPFDVISILVRGIIACIKVYYKSSCMAKITPPINFYMESLCDDIVCYCFHVAYYLSSPCSITRSHC